MLPNRYRTNALQTEIKGTGALAYTAEELKNFSKSEESLLKQQIKTIADTGAMVIAAKAKFGDVALHYMNEFGSKAVKLN